MGFLITSINPQAAYYDVAENGGAIGTIPVSSFVIPYNFIVTRFLIKTFVTFVGGAGATISIDLVRGAVVTPGFFMPVTPFAAFTAGTVTPGFDFNATPLPIETPGNLTNGQMQITIAGNALTAGRFGFHCETVGMDNLL